MARSDFDGIIARVLKDNGIGCNTFGNPLVSEDGDHEFEIMMAEVSERFSQPKQSFCHQLENIAISNLHSVICSERWVLKPGSTFLPAFCYALAKIVAGAII